MASIFDQSQALGGGMSLVPDYAERQLRQRLADMQERGLLMDQRQQEQQVASAQQQQQRFAEFQEATKLAWGSGDPRAIGSVMMQFPEYQKQIKDAYDMQDGVKRQSDLQQLSGIFAALHRGRPDVAAASLKRRIESDRAAGQDTAEDQQILDEIESGDPDRIKAAMGMAGFQLSSITGPEKFASTVESLGLKPELRNQQPGEETSIIDPLTGDSRVIAKSEFVKDAEGNIYRRSDLEGGGQASGGAADGSFDTFHRNFLAPVEGGYAASDGRSGAPVNFGVNQKANPDLDVKNLTPEQAKTIMRDRYWKRSGADKMPPRLAEVHMDTAVNMGVGAAAKLLKQAGGNVERYLDLREKRYREIGGPDLTNWLNRNERLRSYVTGGGGSQRVEPQPVLPRKDAVPTGYRRTANGDLEAIPGGPADKPAREAPSGYRFKPNGDLEAIPGGPAAQGVGGGKVVERETGLRKEFDGLPVVKRFGDIRAARGQIQTIARKGDKATAQDDIALVFSFMRMLDPGSVVREGEFATAQNAAGIPERVRNMYNQARDGQRLSPEQRRSMGQTAESLYIRERDAYNAEAERYQSMAKQYGVEPTRVARRVVPDGPQGGAPVRVRSVQEAQKLPAGTTFIGPNGKTYRKR